VIAVATRPDTRALVKPSQALLRAFEAPIVVRQAAPEPADPVVAPVAAESGERRRQGFRIGSLRLMMRYEDGNELAVMPKLSALPNAPGWLLGMANLHGSLVPIFDLASYFHAVGAGSAQPMLLVLGHGGDRAGVVIDGLPERMRWTAAQQADAGAIPEALLPIVHCAVMLGDDIHLDLNVPALLDTLEHALSGAQ